MDEIEYKLEQSRKRVFFNSLISTVSDIIILVLLLRTGGLSGWSTVIPVFVVMALAMAMHGRTILFQMGYVPQYIFDCIQGRTARDMIEESAAAAGISYYEVAEDLLAGPEEFQYLGERNLYFFYVDKVYIIPREKVAWFYFTGWRMMTRLFHWETFYLPHIGLNNGEIMTPMGYVFSREEFEKLMDGGETLLPRAVMGRSDKLARLYAFDREKFLALRYIPNETILSASERAEYLDSIDDPAQNPKGMNRDTMLKSIGALLLGVLVALTAIYFLMRNTG